MRRAREREAEPTAKGSPCSLACQRTALLAGALLLLLAILISPHLSPAGAGQGIGGPSDDLASAQHLWSLTLRLFTPLRAQVPAPGPAPGAAPAAAAPPVATEAAALAAAAPQARGGEAAAGLGSQSGAAESASQAVAESGGEGSGGPTLGRVAELEEQLAAVSAQLLQAHGQVQGQGQVQVQGQVQGQEQGRGQEEAKGQGQGQGQSFPLPTAAIEQVASTKSSKTSPIPGPATPGSDLSLSTTVSIGQAEAIPAPTTSAGKKRGASGVTSGAPPAAAPVCWEAPKGASTRPKGGIAVRGAGCRGCTAGRLCAFDILVRPPGATWHADPASRYKWELMVTMRGPAMAAADLAPGTGAPHNQSHTLRATYRIWDAGTYRVLMRAVCLNLYFPGRNGRSDFVGEWTLTVSPAQEDAGGDVPLPSPCDNTLHARWLASKGTYRWVPFPCAPKTPPVQDIPGLLWKRRGIREINLVGDSRLRVLTLHLYHLFVAGEAGKGSRGTYPYHRVQKRGAFSFRVPLPRTSGSKGGFLRLNFHFTDFILREDEYGCRHLWAKNLPPGWKPAGVSRTADVTLINVGSWTGANCLKPELAISSHMEAALAWASERRKKGSKLVLRSASTMYRATGCRATNSFLRYTNVLGRTLCPRYKATFFDSWQVEAPRFSETCSLHDHHYSCIRQIGGGKAYMGGDVGEAVAMAFLHYLLYIMP